MKRNIVMPLTVFLTVVLGFVSHNFCAQIEPNGQGTINQQRAILQKYIEISSLTNGIRQKAFSGSSKEEKANLFKFHLAFQFVTHPNLTKDQNNLILDSISSISSDDYDHTKDRANVESKTQIIEARAKSIFPGRDMFEIFANLESTENDLKILNKYLEALNLNAEKDRRTFFHNAQPDEKRAIWKTKLAIDLAIQDFTRTQQDFILDGISLLSDKSLYSVDLKGQSKILRDNFLKRALELFSKEQVFGLFISLSGESGCSKPTVSSSSATSNLNPEPCTCSYSEYCQLVYGPLVTCRSGCMDTPDGCGVFGDSSCTGVCRGIV